MSTSMAQTFSQAYQPFYIAILLVCLVISSEVYGRIQRSIGRESENTAFKKIIFTYVIYIINDLLWIYILPKPGHTTFARVLEFSEAGILSVFTFLWFGFAEYYIDGFTDKMGKIKHIFYLPVIIAIINAAVFILNRVGILGASLWPASYIYMINSPIDFFYLFFAFAHTMYKMHQEKRPNRQLHERVIMECMLYPAIGAIASLFIYYVPFIILGILPSIIKVLIEMQNAHIYTDALTGINNRYRVSEYLEREWENCSVDHPIYIYLIDINKFKSINDKYGHLVGDQALVTLAETLKKIASEGIVIGRFGGDEFILVDSLNHDPEAVKKEIRIALQEAARQKNFAFDLTISIGYAKCTNAKSKVTDIVASADDALYQDKKRTHK
ncbi:MAG: GGDEF domain-containing protein [Intestinibaculum porci]|uniref:GGDEF domain-containing protein n=1 Tax=Intestinibaculum porci TaxID=2487118 RepID=UPI003F00FD0D